ncbi:hypothetical protein FIV00_20775 [Labrenzia sp. THAF82]|nr:hypothetical protein FIV00_20775 [Labrenzia sp. THAF82]
MAAPISKVDQSAKGLSLLRVFGEAGVIERCAIMHVIDLS